MRSMAVPQAPLPRRRSLAAPLLAAAAAVTALLAAAPRFLLPTIGGAAFVSGPSGALGLAPSRAASTAESRVARWAEVVDVDATDIESSSGSGLKDNGVESVLDGQKRAWFKQKFDGMYHKVFRANWTYIITDTGETGEWNRASTARSTEVSQRQVHLPHQAPGLPVHSRIKHGMGQRYPNGKYIFLTKLQGSPFTRELYGEKYIGKAEWTYHPNEVKAKEKVQRARELKRTMAIETEERRVAHLRQLGVWPGESHWRPKLLQEVPLKYGGAASRK
eukprot:CAMPEP_0115075702 /NCGR_PEP_ID=MMETSP0227-20121206/16016_1 /TAXON_ID=89957 /ORGANISM="Polarella glacialis, Strain CCMP 1383" /LENGTH=275 /DNA_ID=CAMNT_0002462757 /DNA_START=1 /DNA_END=828 /DNA_ORIENTATION=+